MRASRPETLIGRARAIYFVDRSGHAFHVLSRLGLRGCTGRAKEICC